MAHLTSDRRTIPLTLTGLAAALVLVACEPSPTDPGDAPAVAIAPTGPAAAVYGIGDLQRAVPRPCPAPEHRQFDFRLGRWEVRDPETGALRGLDEITRDLGGCVQMEEFTAPNGFRSRSLSVYDGETDTWHQAFLSANTTNIRFTGGLVGSNMVFTAVQPAFDVTTGTIRLRENRVTWVPNDDGTMTSITEAAFEGEPLPTVESRWVPAVEFDPAPPLFVPLCTVIAGFRTLDFWVGDWAVAAADGPDLGTSEVETDLSGCLLEESFVGPNGYRSRSFVFYDFVTDTWFRTLADMNGEHIALSGRFESGPGGGRVVMTGVDRTPDGAVVDLRVTLTDAGDGGVLQTWEQSRDGGETWRTTLDLTYVPRG